MRVAGMISGTSVDGIDVAVVDVEDERIETVAHGAVPYDPPVREAILAASNRVTHVGNVSRLNFLVGELFAAALVEVCRRATVDVRSIELIGSHGQTIFHEGEAGAIGNRLVASTLQIGDGCVIAERTGIRTVSDFRTADMAAGGKGAPLAPFLDYRVFRHPEKARLALNIGGIANITAIPANATPEHVAAFDTGPGNMVMDLLAPPFDRDGAKARAGTVNEPLLERLLQDEYYHRRPPKTAGREQYGAEFLATGIDLTTAAELTARTIAMAIAEYPDTQEVIVSGGGAHNDYLMERLRVLMPSDLIPSSDFGLDVDAKEAILFAVIAYERAMGRPGNIPSATGARRAVPLGKISG
jgi:anhydro-N-acetylmuramic acid kinase